MLGARLCGLILFLFAFGTQADSDYARRIRQEIREEAYNYLTRNPAIQELLHYPGQYSHPKFPCADFVSWILEATVNFPKRPDDPLIVVQARSNYRYMIQKMGWKIIGTYDLKKLPTDFEKSENPSPQGCLAYYYKRAPKLKFINIRHVGVVYSADSQGIKIIDASGHLGSVVHRPVNDSVLMFEGNYATVQFVCPPDQAP